jgi:hypothetical protein
MNEPITALAELAAAAYVRSDPTSWREKWPAAMLGVITDPDRSQLMNLAVADCSYELNHAILALSAVPDLSIFLPGTGAYDPALVYPGGSMRQPFSQFVTTLLVSAAQRLYFLRQESTEALFTEAVIENYEDLLNQGRGDPIRAYELIGFTGVELAPDVQVDTPWGILRTAPANFRVGLPFNPTKAILAAPCTMALGVSREEYPTQLATERLANPNVDDASRLLPLAFALASEQNPRCAPMTTARIPTTGPGRWRRACRAAPPRVSNTGCSGKSNPATRLLAAIQTSAYPRAGFLPRWPSTLGTVSHNLREHCLAAQRTRLPEWSSLVADYQSQGPFLPQRLSCRR